MREVPASDAATNLDTILDDVEQGNTVAITRNGRTVARIVPGQTAQSQAVDRALATFGRIRERTVGMTLEEILSARHEGHRD